MSTQPISSKFDIIAWMTEHGHPGYAREIAEIQSFKSKVLTEPHLNEFDKKALEASLNQQIAEIRQEAQDRYDDWASDPLP